MHNLSKGIIFKIKKKTKEKKKFVVDLFYKRTNKMYLSHYAWLGLEEISGNNKNDKENVYALCLHRCLVVRYK